MLFPPSSGVRWEMGRGRGRTQKLTKVFNLVSFFCLGSCFSSRFSFFSTVQMFSGLGAGVEAWVSFTKLLLLSRLFGNTLRKVKSLSRVWLFATPWTVAYQAPPSMGFSRQEYWSGLPFPSPGDLPNSGIEPGSPTFQADALTSEPPGKPGPTLMLLNLGAKNLEFLLPSPIREEILGRWQPHISRPIMEWAQEEKMNWYQMISLTSKYCSGLMWLLIEFLLLTPLLIVACRAH